MEAITAEAIAKAVEVVLRRMDFTPENTIGWGVDNASVSTYVSNAVYKY
jgi:hypothetical protein